MKGTRIMATIQKTYTTRLDNVVAFADGVRASVSIIDSQDSSNVTAHLIIVVKDGKVIQPAVDVPVDASIASATSTLMAAFTKLVDLVVAAKPIILRGSVPPAQQQRPQP